MLGCDLCKSCPHRFSANKCLPFLMYTISILSSQKNSYLKKTCNIEFLCNDKDIGVSILAESYYDSDFRKMCYDHKKMPCFEKGKDRTLDSNELQIEIKLKKGMFYAWL
jgi:hypothetical protein